MAYSKSYIPTVQVNLLSKFGEQDGQKLKIPPRQKILKWRLLQNILPDYYALCWRNILVNSNQQCLFFKSADELASHIFFICCF